MPERSSDARYRSAPTSMSCTYRATDSSWAGTRHTGIDTRHQDPGIRSCIPTRRRDSSLEFDRPHPPDEYKELARMVLAEVRGDLDAARTAAEAAVTAKIGRAHV